MARTPRRRRPRATDARPIDALARLERTPWFLPALGAAGLLMAVLLFDPNLSLSGDNAEFIVLGRSLAAGQGLVYIQKPVPDPATKYPFGFPLLLAAVETLFPGNLLALKALVCLLFALAIPLLYRFLRRYARPPLALGICLVCLVSPPLLDYAHQVMSEIPYLAASLLALLLLEKAVEHPDKKRLLWAVLAVMGAYYIRSAGIALVGAAIAFLLLKNRPRDAGLAAGACILLALPWALRNAAIGGTSYTAQLLSVNPYRPDEGMLTFSTLIDRILANLQIYGLREIPRAIFPPAVVENQLTWAFGLPLGALLVYALVTGLRRRELPAVYLFFYLGMCLGWPWVWSDIRFLLPAIPLLLYAVFGAVRDLLQCPGPAFAPLLIPLVLLSFGGNLYATQRLSARIGDYPPNWRNYFQAAAWIRDNTPPETIVSCPKGYLMYVVSHRKTVGYVFSDQPGEVLHGLEADSVDLVVVDQLGFSSTPRYLVPAVNAHRDRFTLLHLVPDPDTYILNFKRSP